MEKKCKQILPQQFKSTNWNCANMLLLVEDKIFFIQRTANMPTHGGQIGFVGGFKKKHEMIPWEVATREMQEEIGIQASKVEFLGHLNEVRTLSHICIAPTVGKYIGKIDEFKKEIIKNSEWDEAFLVDFKHLFCNKNWHRATWYSPKGKQELYFLNFQSHDQLNIGEASNVILWGATAKIVRDFMSLL